MSPAAAASGGRQRLRRARVQQLTLLSRAYCHLCDEMLAALAPLADAHGATIVGDRRRRRPRARSASTAIACRCCSPATPRPASSCAITGSTPSRSRPRWAPIRRRRAEVAPEAKIPLKFNMIRATQGHYSGAPLFWRAVARPTPRTCTTSATFRSSPTSTTASRRSPTASSSAAAASPTARWRSRCSTRWTSSASAASRSRRRPPR